MVTVARRLNGCSVFAGRQARGKQRNRRAHCVPRHFPGCDIHLTSCGSVSLSSGVVVQLFPPSPSSSSLS
ncbi:unnamed protein product [Cyprideis torosa]|uniref:Uncharacterized protein n=1 Tax=Cyprideis torosa TaxID=163714 RepID=A0A7R8W7C0_9CRUS|nr:unnamed protein product [Cyprideis torosa]CAG0887410.1 unnamed protein product [Cyprideis torosa]